MVTKDWMVDEVLKVVPDAKVEVIDLHGSGDHFHVRVISATYDGIRPLQRQRPILDHFKSHITSNAVHALDLRCMTPEQASPGEETAFDPHSEEAEFFGVHIRRTERE